MHHPIETANIVLIVVGVLLVLSGPYITYRTLIGMKQRSAEPSTTYQHFSNGLNFVIAVLFFGAGILFVVNNLRGNPLS